MKEAQFISVLAHPRLDFCAQVVANTHKQLCIAFSLKGENANSFCKDLASEFATWQIHGPEQLHQQILDLLSFTRKEKLELEFALSLLHEDRIIFAAYSGEVILKRHGKSKKILSSEQEIKIVAGTLQTEDQIVLSNRAASWLNQHVLEMLTQQFSLEKIVSKVTLLQEEQQQLDTSLAFVNYHEQTMETPVTKRKVSLKKFLSKILIIKLIFRKIIFFAKKIPVFFKKIIIYLKTQNRKKIIISGVTTILLVLAMTGTIKMSKQHNEQIFANIENKITNIDGRLNSINQLLAEQPIKARELAQASLDETKQLKQEKNNKKSLQLIDTEISKLEQLIEQIAGDNSLDKLSIAYDLNNFLTSKIEFKNGELFALESNGQEILHIKVDHSRETLNFNQQKIRDFTVSNGYLFIQSSGIQVLNLADSQATFQSLKEEGESDRDGIFLTSFGPYLYLVNANKRNIYRYYFKDGVLSDPIGWLVDKQGINFENISDLLVDGDLWLAFKTGSLLKFIQGGSTDFTIQGLAEPLSASLTLSTNETSNKLVILEKQNKRLLVFTKDGQFISEFTSNELAGVSSIAINEDDTKVYAASGSIIYEIEI